MRQNEDLCWTSIGKGNYLSTNPSELHECDMLTLRVTKPDQFLVGVDVGVNARPLGEANEEVLLVAQVATIESFPKVRMIGLNCHDRLKSSWYHVDLRINLEEPYDAELCAYVYLTPPKYFGRTLPDMNGAFREFAARVRALHEAEASCHKPGVDVRL